MKKIAMASLNALFAKIAADKKLYLPIEKAGKVDFYEWNEGETVRLDVLKTVKSANASVALIVLRASRRVHGNRILRQCFTSCHCTR